MLELKKKRKDFSKITISSPTKMSSNNGKYESY